MSIYLWEGTTTVVSDMKWPCPDGFHIPLQTEWSWLSTIMSWLWLSSWNNWMINLHMPFAWYRNYSNGNLSSQGSYWFYWSSSHYSSNYEAYNFVMNSSTVNAAQYKNRTYWYSIRPFKNEFVVPTSSWTIIKWTLWWAWIFWDQTNWLISITSNWSTWYTIMDKNLWATTVFNSGGSYSEATCWWFFQWWNNNMFPRQNSMTTSTSQVNANNYWPWNYYSSNTFIVRSSSPYWWDSSNNNNLRWWVSQWSSTIVDTWIKSAYIWDTKAKAVYVWTTEVWNAWNSNWDNIDVLFSWGNGTIIHWYNSSNWEIKLTDANGNITIIEDRNVWAVNINDYWSYIRADTAANYDSWWYHTPSQWELYNFIQTRNNITWYTNDWEKMRDILLMPFAWYTENGRNYDVWTTWYYLSRNSSSWAWTWHIRIWSWFISYYAQWFSNIWFTTIRRFKDT